MVYNKLDYVDPDLCTGYQYLKLGHILVSPLLLAISCDYVWFYFWITWPCFFTAIGYFAWDFHFKHVNTKLAFVWTYQIISEQCLISGYYFKPDCFIRILGKLSSTVITTVKMDHIKQDSEWEIELTWMYILGWVLGMYA